MLRYVFDAAMIASFGASSGASFLLPFLRSFPSRRGRGRAWMTVPPGWYADINHQRPGRGTRGGSSSQAIMLSLLCSRLLARHFPAPLGEGSSPYRKTPAACYQPRNTSCARRTSPAKPMLSKLASCKTLASRAALPAAQHVLRRPSKAPPAADTPQIV